MTLERDQAAKKAEEAAAREGDVRRRTMEEAAKERLDELANQRQSVQIQGQQFATAVYLVKALGGGWQASAPLFSKN